MEAIISGEVDIIVAFSYVTKFPKDFPRGILERKEGANNIHRIKARKLLTWLHEQGHTFVTVDALRRQRAEFSKVERKFADFEDDFIILNETILDENQEVVDNSSS